MQFSKKSANKILVFSILLLLPILLMLVDGQAHLRYQSLATINHEYWRWVTGHWVHLSWGHLWMNWLALLILMLSFFDLFNTRVWVIFAIAFSMLISVGFILFSSQLVWYVGLSGLLHGLFVVCMLADRKLSCAIRSVFLLALSAKLIWEQLYGALPGSTELAGGNVIVDAHLFGAISGLIVYLGLVASQKYKASSNK